MNICMGNVVPLNGTLHRTKTNLSKTLPVSYPDYDQIISRKLRFIWLLKGVIQLY